MKNIIIILLIALLAVSVGILGSIINRGIYAEQFECNLILEQRVACFWGCHEFDEQVSRWEKCIDMCENRYYTDFNEDGSIKSCEYWRFGIE